MNNNWRYAGIEYDDVANGDGLGAVFFVQGCSHHCPGCQNQQTWDFSGGMEVTEAVINDLTIYFKSVPFASRLTISGGDPLDPQNVPLTAFLITFFKSNFPDKHIWIYTGYKMEDVYDRCKDFLKLCDYVVDGQFIEAERDITLRYRGSANQKIIKISDWQG